nr:MAG TPA: Chromodomain-helicase-DNA-binding protein 4 [Bacteriophage sp.]
MHLDFQQHVRLLIQKKLYGINMILIRLIIL